MDKLIPSLSEIMQASERLKGVLHHTELDHSATFSRMSGGNIYLKCENRQKTGSFKIRGATNKIASLMEKGELKSVVASSAGNHAQGVASAAKSFGIPATIVMPAAAPIAKVQATEGYGANVVLHGSCYDDAYAKACEICETEGATFLHPYNDLEVIAGQGTLGLEILGDLPTVDMIIVPAGGGGLLSGTIAAVKQVNPRVKVYGVQAEGANAIARSFREHTLVCTDTAATIADGIAVKGPGDICVDIINDYCDGVVTVSDTEISGAILLLMERCKQIVEPVKLGLHFIEMGEGLRSLLEDGASIFGHKVLGKVGYYSILGSRNGSTCRCTYTGKNLEQGTLSCTVLTHEGNTVLLVYNKGYVAEKRSSTEFNCQTIY